LVKKDIGDIFRRQPSEYNDIFNFDVPMEDSKRQMMLDKFFDDFIVPFTHMALTKKGIKQLHEKGEIFILPAVQEQLLGLEQG